MTHKNHLKMWGWLCLLSMFMNEFGTNMGAIISWTGTIVGGFVRSGVTCGNWTSSSGSDHQGGIGIAGHADAASWLVGSPLAQLSCASTFNLICLEQASVP